MGLRSKIKKFADRFSGEFSQASDGQEVIPYSRDGNPNDGSDVVKARLKRPRESSEDDSDPSSSES